MLLAIDTGFDEHGEPVDEADNFGIVVLAAMGMAQVSGIVLGADIVVGGYVEKGQEFANFAFGGSDFVSLYQNKANFRLNADLVDQTASTLNGITYKHLLQGQDFGRMGPEPTPPRAKKCSC